MQANKYLFKKLLYHFTIGCTSMAGRNHLGRICVFHKGGGNKRKYRYIDFFRRVNDFGIIVKIFKDSFRTAFTAFVLYRNGLFAHIVMAEGLDQGSYVYSGYTLPVIPKIDRNADDEETRHILKLERSLYGSGSALPIRHLTLFTKVNNVELYPHSGSVLCRSAGVSALYIGYEAGRSLLKLNSGWQLSVNSDSMATIGIVSNFLHRYYNFEKAGAKRLRGIRPTVRGVAKNPCDHPHGGGEGKASPPRAQVSPWGKLTKGTPTTNKKKSRLNRRLFKNIDKNI